MKRMLLLAAALALGTTGCLGGPHKAGGHRGPADACPSGECESEPVVVHAPKTKVVVEQPYPPPAPAPAPPTGAPALPPAPPVGAMMPAPPMAPMMGTAVPSYQVMGAPVRDRTALGFTIDFIRIPIPWLRPIAVQRPAEVTLQVQPQPQPVGYAPMPAAGGFAPVGYGMPAYGFGVAPQPAMGYGGVGMVPQPVVGYGQVTYATQVPVGQVPPVPPVPPAVVPTPVPTGAGGKSQQDVLEECMRKLEESQRKLRELEKKDGK